MTAKRATALVLASALLAACAVAPPVGDANDNPAWRVRSAQLAKIDRWQVQGRIGVVREREAWSASLAWRQDGTQYAIDLLGPFGAGRVHVEGDANGVTLFTGDGQQLSAADADELIERATGVAVPVAALRDWVLGRPQAGVPARLQADVQGRLTRIEQAGWVVEYGAWQAQAPELPLKLRAEHGDVQVRLSIERWDT